MTAVATSAPPATVPGLGAVRATIGVLIALGRNPAGAIGLFGVTFFLVLAFVGPSFVALDTKAKLDKIYLLPSAEYPLGTDYQGRDVLSQIVHGGRDIIIVASTTALITTTIAVTLGALAGFLGGNGKGTPCSSLESGRVVEDAGTVHHAGLLFAVSVDRNPAVLLGSLEVLPMTGLEPLHCLLHGLLVLLVEEMSTEGTAALAQFGRWIVVDTLTSLSEDALEIRIEERRVDGPRSLLVGVLETDPFMGKVFVRHVTTLDDSPTSGPIPDVP